MNFPISDAASTQPVSAVSTNLREFLTLPGAKEYGIGVLRHHEWRFIERPGRVANSPAFVKDVVNLTGEILYITDMAQTRAVVDHWASF